MKKIVLLLLVSFSSGLSTSILSASPVNQDQFEALQKKLIELEVRVKDLEAQFNHVKTDQDIVRKEVLRSPWQRLKMGMYDHQVVKLLGKPISKRKGGVAEFWYYSDLKSDGAYVKFLFSRVDSWEAAK